MKNVDLIINAVVDLINNQITKEESLNIVKMEFSGIIDLGLEDKNKILSIIMEFKDLDSNPEILSELSRIMSNSSIVRDHIKELKE